MAKRVSTTDSKYYTAELYDGSRKTFVQSESRTKTVKEFSLFGLVLFLLIVVSIIGILSGKSGQRTFFGFLEMLSNVPTINFEFATDLLDFSLSFPRWLDWAEVILEVAVRFLGLLGFFVQGLCNSCSYIYYFIRWVFIL